MSKTVMKVLVGGLEFRAYVKNDRNVVDYLDVGNIEIDFIDIHGRKVILGTEAARNAVYVFEIDKR